MDSIKDEADISILLHWIDFFFQNVVHILEHDKEKFNLH